MVREYLGLHAAGRASLAQLAVPLVVPLSLCGTTSCSANAWAGDVPHPCYGRPEALFPPGRCCVPDPGSDWISTSAPETPTPYASIDLPKTAAVTDAFGLRHPPDPELLFDALHGESVDYVVIGAFGQSNAHGAVESVEAIELTHRLEQSRNCAGLTEVLVNLDARRLLSFRDRKPVDRHAPMRILDGEFISIPPPAP